ncbi:MAG: TylF/MycF family methyltransferase [Sporichthyaceae bacterium]
MMDTPAADLYLTLLANVLTRHGLEHAGPALARPEGSYRDYLLCLLEAEADKPVLVAHEALDFDSGAREIGRDWPSSADTMVGLRRLANIRECTETVIRDKVPGDLIETGVWRGGSCIFMRAILKAHGVTNRTVWVADSFQGLPPPDARYPADEGDVLFSYPELAVSAAEVQGRFAYYGLLDEQVKFLPGFFEDTLATAPIDTLAVLRLDGDMYASTMVALLALYDKVSAGGFVIVDDFSSIPACAKAVEDFRGERGITDPIHEIDWTGVYWRKS